MNQIFAYKLNFISPLHIGMRGVGYEETEEIIHSDTLFSSLMNLWGDFYEDNIEELCNNPPFVISSCFPYKKDTYFFPRPMVQIGKHSEDDIDPKIGKRLKKTKYISKTLFEKVLQGEEIGLPTEDNTLQKGKFWFEKQDKLDSQRKEKVFSQREVPRVKIDRLTNSSDIFYFSEIVFEKDSGLFFLAKFNGDEIKKKFETILRLLGDEGIGSDKRVGKGLFILQGAFDFSFLCLKEARHFLTLSLYHPTKEEIELGILNQASYELLARYGWIHSFGAMSLRRQWVRMFKEGSVFQRVKQSQYGDNPIVQKRDETIGLLHNIYRYGLCFDVPIKKEG
jgi:CRISPR-associated protein Csm4